jgi:hydrogenase nickel incorporation protein HypA/HybF
LKAGLPAPGRRLSRQGGGIIAILASVALQAEIRAPMHEMALTGSIVDIVCEEARKQGFCKVRVVRLQIGVFAPIEPEALRFCFDAVSRGTAAEGATLDIVRRPGEGWCLDCGKTVALSERFGDCPECGKRHVQLTSGDELRIEELEVD